MINKREEYSFSLDPAGDNDISIYLKGDTDENEEKIEKRYERPRPKVSYEEKERPKKIPKISSRKEAMEIIEKPKENIIKFPENKEKEEKRRAKATCRNSRIRVILTAFLLISGLIYLILYTNPTITMNIGEGDFTPLTTFAEKVDYAAANNQSFVVDLDYSKFNREGRDASVGIAGSVTGSGIVKVYLANEKGEKYFLYDSEVENSEKFFRSTKVTGSTTENQENADDRKFEYSCIDTCYPKINEGRYILEVEVDGNAEISIDKMIFGF